MRVCRVCRRCYDDSNFYCSEEGHPGLEDLCAGDPEMVAGYTLDVLSGTDAAGNVYRARQMASDGVCQIGIVNCPAETEQEFLREARSAAAFFHPNVVDVYEAGKLDSGEIYIISEYTHARTLREFLDTNATPDLLTTVQIARQTAEALHAIHLKGLVHRAVNTENIVLSFDDLGRSIVRIKDIDFGGARTHSIISNKFLIDSALYSLRYFAPEQCDGEAAGIKTDIYSLGIVLYEMLAGSPPFNASKASGLIELHRHRLPPEITIDNFDLRMLLTHTLTESLQKQTRLRQSSANAVARQLRHIEQLTTHVSTPPPAGIVPPLPARSVPRVTVNLPYTPTPLDLSADVVSEPKPVVGLDVFSEPIEIGHVAADHVRCEAWSASATESEPDNIVANVAAIDRSRLKVHRKRVHRKPPEISQITTDKPEITPVNSHDNGLEIDISRSEPQPVVREAEKPLATALHHEPAKIEWQTPDDDIPSIEDIMEALATEPASAVPSAILSEPLAPLLPDEGRIPMKTGDGAVRAALGLNPPAEPAIKFDGPPLVDTENLSPKNKSQKSVQRINNLTPKRKPPVQHEQDEITVVTARSRPIRIDIDRPTPKRKRLPDRRVIPEPANEFAFFPTLLGADGANAPVDTLDTGGLFLSSYTSVFQSQSTLARRSATVVGGLVLLISLFMFGGRFLRLDVLADRDNEPIAATTAPVSQSISKVTQPPAPSKRSTVNAKTPPAVSNEKPRSPSNENSADKKPAPAEQVKRDLRNSAATASPAAKARPQKTERESPKVSMTPAPVKTATFTRPRIVTNPKP